MLRKICALADLFHKIAVLGYDEALKYFDLPADWKPNPEELKKRFKTKAFDLHPDRNKSPTANEEFVALMSAYEVIERGPGGNDTPKETGNDTPEEPDLWGEKPWRHQYHTPINQYDDLEKWEYYTNPAIEEQYERDFHEEQEFAKEDYERNAEEAWERDLGNSQDNISNIEDLIRGRNPDVLLETIGRDLEDQLQMLGLDRKDIDIRRFTKAKDLLAKEIDAACYTILVEDHLENHPDRIAYLVEIMNNMRDINDYTRFVKNPKSLLSPEEFARLMQAGVVKIHDVHHLSEPNRIAFFELVKDHLLTEMSEPGVSKPGYLPRSKMGLVNIVWRMPPESRVSYEKALLDRTSGRDMTRIEQDILHTLRHKM